MAAITVYGRVTDALGASLNIHTAWDGQVAREHREYKAIPATEYRTAQPNHIPINREHRGPTLGEIVHLERDDCGISAVAVVENFPELALPHDGDWYFSGELAHCLGRDCEIRGVGIVRDPAVVGLRPLDVHLGDVRNHGVRARWHNRTPQVRLLERAGATYDRRQRRSRDPLTIEDLGRAPATEERHRGTAPTEHRPSITHDPNAGWLDERGNPIPGRATGVRRLLPDGSTADIEHRPGGAILAVR